MKDGEVNSNTLLVYACAVEEAERRDLAFDLPQHWQARQMTRAKHPNEIIFKDDILSFPDVALLSETKVKLKCDMEAYCIIRHDFPSAFFMYNFTSREVSRHDMYRGPLKFDGTSRYVQTSSGKIYLVGGFGAKSSQTCN